VVGLVAREVGGGGSGSGNRNGGLSQTNAAVVGRDAVERSARDQLFKYCLAGEDNGGPPKRGDIPKVECGSTSVPEEATPLWWVLDLQCEEVPGL
jgi:hypothetical protein